MGSKNNEVTPYYLSQHQEHGDLQYINLTNMTQGIEDNNSSNMLNEIRSLREEIKQRDENSQKLIKILTEEVIALRNEVRQLKSINNNEGELNLLPNLPFYSFSDLKQFDEKVLIDDSMRNQFKYLIQRIGGSDLKSFLKLAIKTVISDDLAIDITWRGTATKPSIQGFAVFKIIKDICHLKFKNASEFEINKMTQQHFLHARDRVVKKQKQPI